MLDFMQKKKDLSSKYQRYRYLLNKYHVTIPENNDIIKVSQIYY